MLEKIVVHTTGKSVWMDITDQVRQLVERSQVKEGMVVVYCPHTTAGITINEGADPDVVFDLLYGLEKISPWKDPAYRHGEGNTAAHMKATLVGTSQTIPVTFGKMVLGMWQSIYFCEFDGPRRRNFFVKILEG
ncbi:YjbQ family protein [Alkalibacter rhizosphaerae]|uniref:YjbQ family protein n=1 Tax=Alkalibacter rhizosphaerae TaxID=2815577 RepID=A0A975AH47_9FIRM|nr:secondary thiamine-phosphate synthase enzyme YjbQ [Alkalibacter rhizosphaerae]QSX07628.1 YjbQ family protein [Alkalibacter rhizosphaerae]